MSSRTATTNAAPAPPLTANRYLPVLLLLFIGSGLCALIYEVVWFQLLELVIGSSAISLGVLLATFMGGMCAGSLLLPRYIARHQHPLRVYACLELGIGLLGLLELVLVPLVGNLYSSSVGHGFAAIMLRAVVCVICLLPPTVLMGATLPAIARWVETTPHGVSWLGFFYGGNIVGAVIGSVVAGFYLLRVFDVTVATIVAAAINTGVAAIGLTLAARTAGGAAASADTITTDEPVPGRRAVYLTIALSGACALGAEVVWTRLLSLMLGASTYTFSMILAVFLSGLGGGSAAGAWLARSIASPRLALGWCQLLQTATVAWAAAAIAVMLPNWPVNPSIATSPWFTMQLDLTRTAWAVLPAAVLWGASFPLALAAVATRGQDGGRLVGRVYAANTLGAIAGAVLFSVVVVPFAGTQGAQRTLIVLSVVAGLFVLGTLFGPAAPAPDGSPARVTSRTVGTVTLAVGLVVAVALLATVPAIPSLLIAYGRYAVTWTGQVDVLEVAEGMNSSIAVTKLRSNGATQFHVAGKVEASSLAQDMRLQRMLGHLPALVHPHPKSVLVVGFGAGVTAGSFIPYPDLERLQICEIEPLIPQVVSRYFQRENNNVLHDKRVHMFYDDARSFILTTDEMFDVITSDPIHPWVKGAASLYTKEYFEAVKAHLNPGGVVTQWVPLYESTTEAVKSEIATFLEVFPHGTIWANNLDGKGYDVVLLAQREPTKIDQKALEERLNRSDYLPVAASLNEVGFASLIDVFATYAGSGAELKPWLAGAAINRDRNLRLMYLAGEGLNNYTSSAILDEIVNYRRFPDGLFVADEQWKQALRDALSGPR